MSVFDGGALDDFMLWSTIIGAYLKGEGPADIVQGAGVVRPPKGGEDVSEYSSFLKESRQGRAIIT